MRKSPFNNLFSDKQKYYLYPLPSLPFSRVSTNPPWLSIRYKGVLCSQTGWSSPSMSHLQNIPSSWVGPCVRQGQTNSSLAKSLLQTAEWTQHDMQTCGLLHRFYVMNATTSNGITAVSFWSANTDFVLLRQLFLLQVVAIAKHSIAKKKSFC